jgi:hypothetical protein
MRKRMRMKMRKRMRMRMNDSTDHQVDADSLRIPIFDITNGRLRATAVNLAS